MKNIGKLQKFAKLAKVDVSQQLVYGILCEEAPDKAGEVFDYASSVPYFKAWNEQFSKAIVSDGVPSVGNLRAMHGKVAAGKFVSMEYDDATKQVTVCAKVVDKNEWEKVLAGVYTGFSIGGSYVKVWQDGDYLKYTAKPSEGSLVDNPCMYGATFTAIKGEGLEEVVKFVGSGEEQSVEKGLYDVQDLAGCLRSLNSCRRWIAYETSQEGDGSTIAGQLKNIVQQLGAILVQYTAEQVSELTAGEEDQQEKAMDAKELQKAIADALAPVVESVGNLNKAVSDMKAKPKGKDGKDGAAAEETDDTAKAAGATLAKFDTFEKATNDRLTKFEQTQTELKGGLEAIGKAVQDLAAGFEKYLAQPETPKAAINGAGAAAVNKDDDANKGAAALNKDAKPEDVIKGIHAAGPSIRN